jgi:hypothetical protein
MLYRLCAAEMREGWEITLQYPKRKTEKKNFFLIIKMCDGHTRNLNIQTSVLMYTITLINTICYTQSSQCICVTLKTCTEQQHSSGSNTKNGYVYICRTQRYLRKLFMRPDAKGIETSFCKFIPLK